MILQHSKDHHHVMGRKVMDQKHAVTWAIILAASMLGAGILPYVVFFGLISE